MRQFFRQFAIWKTLQRHPFAAGGLLFVLLVVGTLALPNVASANEWGDGIVQAFVEILLAISRFFVGLAIFFLSFFIEIAKYNDYINAPTVTVGWLLVRDVANMFFVVVLLVIAFGTILGIEKYEWSHTLKNFIIAAIFINFSKLIAGIIIDVAHVFTTTFLNAVSATAGGNLIQMLHFQDLYSFVVGAEFASGSGQEVPAALIMAGMAAVIFSAFAAWTIGTYAIVMVARLVVLWVLIILSPLAYILGAMPDTESYAHEWWHKFIAQVIVAPVMVFFLWLTFATLGSGSVVQNELKIKVGGEAGFGSEAASAIGANSQAPLSLSILEVSTFENMANFIIAIAMLSVGIAVVQELHVVAGGITQSAQDFMVSVAKIATGVRAASWLGEKGTEGLKSAGGSVLYHMPFGGKFLERQGKSIANIVKYKIGRAAERRGERSQEREKKGLVSWMTGGKKGGGAVDKWMGKWVFNRGLGALTGGLLVGDTAGRADKRAEDWKKVAHLQEEITAEAYSTSSTSASGVRKTDATARLHIIEEMAHAKKDQKLEERLAEIANPKIAKNFRVNAKDADLARKRLHVAHETKAKTEEMKRERTRHEEIEEAEERDKMLVAKNKTPRYKNSVLARHQKEDMDIAATDDYDTTVEKIAFIRSQLVAAPVGSDQHKRLVNEMANLQAVANQRGATYGGGALNKAVEGLALPEIELGDMAIPADFKQGLLKLQAKELSAILGRVVNAAEPAVDAALGELAAVKGEQYQAFMRNWTEGLAKSASDGAINKAGLFRGTYNDVTHQMEYKRADAVADEKWIIGKRDYATTQAKYNKLTGFEGSLDEVNHRTTGNRTVSIRSKEARRRVADMFGSIRENVVNSIDRQNFDTFNAVFSDMNQAEIQSLIDEMRTKAIDDQGIRALIAKTNLQNMYASGTFKIKDQFNNNQDLF